ncbi:hypothetical protein ACLB1E_17830 [Escherichia coli]
MIERLESDAVLRYGVEDVVTIFDVLERMQPSESLLRAVLHQTSDESRSTGCRPPDSAPGCLKKLSLTGKGSSSGFFWCPRSPSPLIYSTGAKL